MTHDEFAEAVAHGLPGQRFFYHGDGSDIDGLTFLEADGETPQPDAALPSFAQVQTWHDEVVANPPAAPLTTNEKLATALATVQADPALAQATKDALAQMVEVLTA